LLRRVAMRLLLHLSSHVGIDEFDVYMLARGAQRMKVTESLHAAIRLVKKYDYARYERMRQDLVGILILPHARTPAAIDEEIRICTLDASRIEGDKSGLATALLLVHESTHARLGRMGIRVKVFGVPRVEAVCSLAEYMFLLRVPNFTNRDTILSRAREKLERARAKSRADWARRAR
jgi:hypothetical protein